MNAEILAQQLLGTSEFSTELRKRAAAALLTEKPFEQIMTELSTINKVNRPPIKLTPEQIQEIQDTLQTN